MQYAFLASAIHPSQTLRRSASCSGSGRDRLEFTNVALEIDASHNPAIEFARDQDADAAIADAAADGRDLGLEHVADVVVRVQEYRARQMVLVTCLGGFSDHGVYHLIDLWEGHAGGIAESERSRAARRCRTMLTPYGHTFTVTTRGQKLRGAWEVDGKDVTITSAFGSKRIAMGRKAPADVAAQGLRDLVDEWVAQRR